VEPIDVKASRIRGDHIPGRRSPFAGSLHPRILPELGLRARGASRPVLRGNRASRWVLLPPTRPPSLRVLRRRGGHRDHDAGPLSRPVAPGRMTLWNTGDDA
jgi:hypothetical protein